MTLAELIEALGGKLAQGSAEFVVRGVNSSALAGESELIFAEDAASTAEALESKAGAVVVRAGSGEPLPHFEQKQVVETDQPRLWFARAAKLLSPAPSASGVHPAAVIGERVELGAEVSIGACAVIGDGVDIGAGPRIEAGVVVGERVRIGDHCRIYPARRSLSRNHVGQSRSGSCRRGAGRGWLRLRARRQNRRLYAVSAAGNAADRRRCGDRRQYDHRSRRAEADENRARNEDR